MIELDYEQLKGELGLDHCEGRSYLGSHQPIRVGMCMPGLPANAGGGMAAAWR